MALRVSSIIGKKKALKLRAFFEDNDLPYSALVNMYQSMEEERKNMIRDHGTSFLDILVDWRFSNESHAKSLQSKNVRSCIYAALIQKLRVGLMALDKVPLREISTQILHLGPTFASDNLLESICRSNSQYFSVVGSGENSIVKIVAINVARTTDVEGDASTSKVPSKSRTRVLLKHFYKAKPELIPALSHKAKFKELLRAYDFWAQEVSNNDNSGFMEWLLALVEVHSPENFAKYKGNIKDLIGKQIINFVKYTPRSISEITENLCINRDRFLTCGMVQLVVLHNPDKIFVVDDSKKLEEQLVKLTEHGEFDLELELPRNMEARIKPLLSPHATLTNVMSNFKFLCQDQPMVKRMARSGCFFKYLVWYGKIHKPKLSSAEFTEHLFSFVKPYLLSALEVGINGKATVESVVSMAPNGLLDVDFVRQAAQFFSDEYELISGNHIAARPWSSTSLDEELPPPGTSTADLELESPGVMHLLAKQPNFGEIVTIFLTLSPASISVLSTSSMSFFEWLISLSKRLMPHDALIFESHLQHLIQQEVAYLQTKQKCQMTVQHAHCSLCGDNPMLLSPNFLNWCLEQPKSPFCVYQSWIYLKNDSGCKRRKDGPSTSMVEQDHNFNIDSLLRCVAESSRLSELLQAIRAVPLEHVGFVLQKCASWYDLLDSNLRDRHARDHLSSLLAEEAKLFLKGKVLHTRQLVSMLSKGVANFVCKEVLEYVLNHCQNSFAMAGMGKDNCKVGLIHQIHGDDVDCCTDEEDALMRQILLYFTSGSSDIPTILHLIRREDSFLHRNTMMDEDFLECFFKMFPMFFYLRGNTVVLTCMALDRKAAYKSAPYPTSTTGVERNDAGSSQQECSQQSSRKRSKSHERRGGNKRKRRRSGSTLEQSTKKISNDCLASGEVIVIESSEDESSEAVNQTRDEAEPSLVVDESDGEKDSLVHVIDSLPCQLVTDITFSILMKNGGKYSANDLLLELLFATTGADESQQIQASLKLFSLFKTKIFEVLRQDGKKLVFIPHPHVADDVIEVQMFEDKDEQTAAQLSDTSKEQTKSTCDPQVEEITSTSETQELTSQSKPLNSSNDSSAGSDAMSPDSPNDDVIKLPESSLEPEELTSPSAPAGETNETTAQGEVHSSALASAIEAAIASTASEGLISAQTAQPNANGQVPTYSFSTTATSPYSYSSVRSPSVKESPSSNVSKQESARSHREHCLKSYLKSFLHISARTCATDLIISSAYRRFQNERFARSFLAFEAYVFDFLVRHHRTFVLSGTSSELGVSKVLYLHGSPTASPQFVQAPCNLNFLKLESEVCTSCCAYLSTRTNQRSSIKDLCSAMKRVFYEKLVDFPEHEIDGVIRCLVLVSTIRSLAKFCFAVQEPYLYLRQPKATDEEGSTTRQHNGAFRSILRNPKVKEAILLMAEVIKNSRPKSQTSLRRLWQAEAPTGVAKIFGTGISFTLSLRKYQFIFPTLEDGSVTTNEEILAAIRKA